MCMKKIKTRFAPSPTGLLHLGNLRTALFNALYAYHHNGTFLLRLEDTDAERSQVAYAQQLQSDLRWLGLDWQEGPEVEGENAPYVQSERSDIYDKYYQQLIDQGQAYPCFCTPTELSISRKLQRSSGQAPRYAGTCAHLSQADIDKKLSQGLQPTLRFRVERDAKITFHDEVRGEQTFLGSDIGDFIIRRADGTPAFFFCNAVDDALMGVTHVLRGEDHLTNTPRQLLILQALGLTAPTYGHISMIVGSDNKPLSKRHGSQALKELRENGWLPSAINNYLARLGHHYSDEDWQSLADLAKNFDLSHLGRAPAHFDAQQMQRWQPIAVAHSDEELLSTWLDETSKTLVPSEQIATFIDAVKANISYPADMNDWIKRVFVDDLDYSDSARAEITKTTADYFQHAIKALYDHQGDYKPMVNQLKQDSGTKGKALFMPLRAALTGQTHGPEMAKLLPLMGIERAQRRLKQAQQMRQ